MQNKTCLVAALLCGVALQAQSQSPPAAGTAAPQVLKSRAYVRRISFGATLSVLCLKPIPNLGRYIVTTSPPVDALYTSDDEGHRIGYGATAQAAITERFAINASLLVRRVGYKMNSDVYTGTDNPYTTEDDRIHTVLNEDTRAKFFDLPVVVRYYGKDRHRAGPRWFFEAGGVVRRVSYIKTSIDSTVGSEDTVCCNYTPATPAHRTIRGMVGGFGVQLIDPVGVRVVPEVRYTRWVNRTFDSYSTLTKRGQLEAMISLTF